MITFLDSSLSLPDFLSYSVKIFQVTLSLKFHFHSVALLLEMVHHCSIGMQYTFFSLFLTSLLLSFPASRTICCAVFILLLMFPHLNAFSTFIFKTNQVLANSKLFISKLNHSSINYLYQPFTSIYGLVKKFNYVFP